MRVLWGLEALAVLSPHCGHRADWSSTRWGRERGTGPGNCTLPSTVLHPATSYWLRLSRLKPRALDALCSSSPCSNLFPRTGCVLERLPATAGSRCQAPAASFAGRLGAGAGRRRGFASAAVRAAELRVNALGRIPLTYLFSSLVTEKKPQSRRFLQQSWLSPR